MISPGRLADIALHLVVSAGVCALICIVIRMVRFWAEPDCYTAWLIVSSLAVGCALFLGVVLAAAWCCRAELRYQANELLRRLA